MGDSDRQTPCVGAKEELVSNKDGTGDPDLGAVVATMPFAAALEIGRASCRERV